MNIRIVFSFDGRDFSFKPHTRNTGASCVDDIIEFCKEVQSGRPCNISANTEHLHHYLDVLCDGKQLAGLEQDTVESVFNTLKEYCKSIWF